MTRLHNLFILLTALSSLVFITGAARAVDDIPASESSEDEIAPQRDEDINPEHKLKKRVEEKTAIPESDADKPIESNVVVLQGLNKVMGRVSTLEISLGTLVRFENLEIIARKCSKSLPEERPENTALLEIREVKAGEEPKQIFLGWMFSSSPALSGLEHPVYDITVLSCEHRKDLEIK